MKHIIYIAASVILFMTSCDKTGPANTQEQYDKYIFFSQSVETKASLIGDAKGLSGKDFGVVGFKYQNNSDWSTYKVTSPAPMPNVFDNNVETVKCETVGEGTFASLQGTYAPLQGWSNTKKYTFFAFYPYSSTLVNPQIGSEYTGGVPAIKHTLDLSNATALKSSMVDVMTAAPCIDMDGSSPAYNGEVTLNFNHCLSALGVNISNPTATDITLTKIDLVISGIQNQATIIPLDGSDANPIANTVSAAEPLTIPITIGTDESVIASTASKEISDKLIFIPQDVDLSVQIIVEYKRGDKEYNTILPGADRYLTTNLLKGKKHLMNLKFTESTIEVSGSILEDGWVKIPEVNDTFN